ncbi:MAG TPA: tetratricopeptide repeat protein, partial [Bacteroidetes bacterium]|nr:tetratricopeptide repeat protein [Bacteroidota bacterium]
MKNNKYLLSAITLMFFSFFLSAQTSVIDSFKQVLDTIAEEQKARIYNRMFDNEQHYTKEDTSLIFAKKALEYSKKNNNDKQKAISLKNIGYFYLTKSRFDSAFLYFNKAIPLLESNKDNKNLIDAYFDLARIYMNQGKLNKASEEIFKALKISEKNNLPKEAKEANQGLGIVYYNLGEYDNALKYLQKALDYEQNKKIKDNGAISRLYQNFGLINYGKKDYEKALEYYFKALKLQQNENSIRDQMIITNSIALCYNEMKNHDKALEYFKKALVLANKTGNPHLIVSAQLNIGETLMNKGKYKKAIIELNKGLDIAKKYNFTKWIRNGYNYLYNCYNYLDDAANALINYQKYRKYDDSLKIEETKQKIAEIESKYESEKKDKQIQLLAKNNEIKSVKLKRRSTLMYAVIAFALLGLIFSLIFFWLLRQRQKARELIKQQESELKFTENLRNYYKLANMLPLVVFFIDKNKRINYINEFGLKLFNINEENMQKGLDIYDTILPINKDDFQKDISKAFENKNTSEKEYKFNIEGKKYFFIGFLSPNVENNSVTGILGVMLDITRIRKMQKEIELTAINTEHKERKRFSADLHDGLGPLLS